MKRMAAMLILPVLTFTLVVANGAQPVGPVTKAPTYPIATTVYTTLDQTVNITPVPSNAPVLLPYQISEYATNGYGKWTPGPGQPYLKPDMLGGITNSVPDSAATTLVSFFTMSDIHIDDKESPAQVPYFGYQNGPTANSSAYSPIILYTTHVLDAAVQTVNALHKTQPFDCGLFLGDACNNNQYNELRWYLDVIDGKWITPSSGAHRGAKTIDYQKPYQAAGLDKSIQWYQTMGNHDQLWIGSLLTDDYIRKILVGSRLLNIGDVPANNPLCLLTRGFYTGVVDGTTEFGDIIDAGPVSYFSKPPRVAADAKRHSLAPGGWMREFLKTTSQPVGHGFTKQLADNGFANYHFYPRADVPIKVIVLDDTDKGGSAALGLDYPRYNWLVSELDAGEAAGELMIIAAHIPLLPYMEAAGGYPPLPTSPPFPIFTTMYPTTVEIPSATLLAKLHTYNNLLMWVSGHVHRNAITPQPDPLGNPEHDFWVVETPSLRDFPQSFRRFNIVRNSDNNISIFALDVDAAVNLNPLPNGRLSPATISRSYAVATQEIFENPVVDGPYINPSSAVYNAELVKQLSPAMQAKIALIPAH